LQKLRFAPRAQVQGVEGYAEHIGWNEAKLRGAESNYTDNRAIDGGQDPTLPITLPQQEGRTNGKYARQIIQTKRHRTPPRHSEVCRKTAWKWHNGSHRPYVRYGSAKIWCEAQGMKVLTEYLKFHTKTHRAYVHMTPQVEEIVRKSAVKEGMALVSAMHITAGVYVNDNESGLIEDIDQWLEHLAPFRKDYKHHETGEDNGDSHLKALLIHHEVIVPITAGKLDLGTWQRIFYAEFDGQRDKRVIVKVMGE
jgi:secondary thiamine-phosphate synthase enzyme